MGRIIEEEIVSILSDYKVYPDVAPIVDGNNDVVAPPFIVYNLISGEGNDQIGNTSSDLIRDTFQIDYYADTSLDARIGADAIYELLCSYSQAVIYGGNQRKDSQDGLHRFSRDYDITYSQDAYNIPPATGEIQITDFEDVEEAIQNHEYESNAVELVAQSDKVYQLAARPGTLELNDDGVWLPERVAISGDTIKLKRTSSADLLTTVQSRLHFSGGSKLWQITTPSALPFPTVDNGLLWLDRNSNVYTDLAGTVEAGLGEAVASWRSIGGSWGTGLATQSTSGLRPLLTADGVHPDASDDYMNIPTLSLDGPYTVYFVASGLPVYPANSNCPILGTQEGYPQFAIDIADFGGFGGIKVRVNNYASINHDIPDISSSYMVRVIRTADSSYRIAATNVDEATGLTSGVGYADSWAYEFIWLGKNYGPGSTTNHHWKQVVVVDGDTVADGTDEAIRTKIEQLEGINL